MPKVNQINMIHKNVLQRVPVFQRVQRYGIIYATITKPLHNNICIKKH